MLDAVDVLGSLLFDVDCSRIGIVEVDTLLERECLERVTADGFEIWASTALEHAMHADQHAAVTLLEDLFAPDLVSDPWLFFWSIGGLDRGTYPDTSDHWDWASSYPEFEDGKFDWDPTVHDRVRTLVEDTGVAAELPGDWVLGDIVR